MMVWAFNQVGTNPDERLAKKKVYDSFKDGKSRFGWSQKDENNLKLKDNWTEEHSRQLFLLEIQKGDWIVHVNTPEYGKCIAAQVLSAYNFDEGLRCEWGHDFRHNFLIDKNTFIEFDRNDPNVLPSVNLSPRYRYQRVYAIDDFHQSIKNIKSSKVTDEKNSAVYHLKGKTDEYLDKISSHIHEMHRGKKLEKFLADVIRNIPGVADVNENGSGWKSDHGADLIVTLRSSLGGKDFEHKIIVQVKSFEGPHNDLNSVNQIKTGIKEFEGTAGILISTGERTSELEEEIIRVSGKIGRPIHLLCGKEVAGFVVQNAPALLFNL